MNKFFLLSMGLLSALTLPSKSLRSAQASVAFDTLDMDSISNFLNPDFCEAELAVPETRVVAIQLALAYAASRNKADDFLDNLLETARVYAPNVSSASTVPEDNTLGIFLERLVYEVHLRFRDQPESLRSAAIRSKILALFTYVRNQAFSTHLPAFSIAKIQRRMILSLKRELAKTGEATQVAQLLLKSWGVETFSVGFNGGLNGSRLLANRIFFARLSLIALVPEVLPKADQLDVLESILSDDNYASPQWVAVGRLCVASLEKITTQNSELATKAATKAQTYRFLEGVFSVARRFRLRPAQKATIINKVLNFSDAYFHSDLVSARPLFRFQKSTEIDYAAELRSQAAALYREP